MDIIKVCAHTRTQVTSSPTPTLKNLIFLIPKPFLRTRPTADHVNNGLKKIFPIQKQPS